MSDQLTDRAQRQQAVASGAAQTAVDRLSPASNPGGDAVETRIQIGGERHATE